MERIKLVAEKLQKTERILSGILKISSVFLSPEKYYGTTDVVSGWIKQIKKQKNLIFISLSDGSCGKQLQVIIDETHRCFEEIKKQKPPACIKVRGAFKESPKAAQPIEMLISEEEHFVEVLGENQDPEGYIL